MKNKSLLVFFIASIFFLVSANSFSQFRPPINGTVTLGTSSPSRLPDFQVQNCTLQARATNAGPIYVGSSIVTNLAGANPGISLAAGGSISNISVNNSNWIYLVADNANDMVTYLCN